MLEHGGVSLSDDCTSLRRANFVAMAVPRGCYVCVCVNIIQLRSHITKPSPVCIHSPIYRQRHIYVNLEVAMNSCVPVGYISGCEYKFDIVLNCERCDNEYYLCTTKESQY